MGEPIYLVYERDETSMTASPKLLGATTDRAVADAAAAAVHARNNWYSGTVVEAKAL